MDEDVDVKEEEDVLEEKTANQQKKREYTKTRKKKHMKTITHVNFALPRLHVSVV